MHFQQCIFYFILIACHSGNGISVGVLCVQSPFELLFAGLFNAASHTSPLLYNCFSRSLAVIEINLLFDIYFYVRRLKLRRTVDHTYAKLYCTEFFIRNLLMNKIRFESEI